MHCGTQHDTCQDGEMAVLCFPIPLLHQDGLVPFLAVERQTITRGLSFLLHLSFILTLSCLFSTLLLSLLRSYISLLLPFSFVLFPSSCSLLHFVAFCLLLFSAPSLSLSVSLSRSASPPSSQLSCSGIVPDHSTSKYLLLTVALCSPHLGHVILKSEGTALLFSMSACSRKRKRDREQERGKRCHPQQSQRDECTLTKSPL